MRPARRILAVDVCGTLYDTNTTAGLVMFHHARRANKWRYIVLRAISHDNSPLRLGAIAISKLTGFDLHRSIVLFSLRRERLAALNASAERYVEDHLPKLGHPAYSCPFERYANNGMGAYLGL